MSRPSTPRCSIAAALIALAAVAVGCCGDSPPPPTPKAQPARKPMTTPPAVIGPAKERPTWPKANVLLISIDTLRADHVGCYGYKRPTTPNIDALCAESLRFETAVAHAPATAMSHGSMLTSLLPPHHGASVMRRHAIPERVETLAETLKAAGWSTASYNGGGQIKALFGFAQGFDVYKSAQDDFSVPVSDAIAWLEGNTEQKFFMFLHTYQIHHPYEPKAEDMAVFDADYTGPLKDHIPVELLVEVNEGRKAITDADRQHIVNAYDAELLAVDRELGRLFKHLKEAGRYDDTLIVVTSDHGEEFGEHGRVGWHSHSLYDELLKVPLLMKLPGGALSGETWTEQVRLIDLPPTVLGMVGVKAPEAYMGVDLRAHHALAEKPMLFSFAERDEVEAKPLQAVRAEKWKLLGRALFDLKGDPGESKDVAPANQRRWAVLMALRDELLKSRPIPREERRDGVELDDETRDTLKSLGYIDE